MGKLCGDKGYIGKDLFEKLSVDGVHLVTKIKKNMKNSLMHTYDKVMLKKRAIIETVNDELKIYAKSNIPGTGAFKTSSPIYYQD